MGVYPESFLRPIRGDVGRMLVRLDRVTPHYDAALKPGAPKPLAGAH
jgi:NADH-quinone oxidoreductase subunit M